MLGFFLGLEFAQTGTRIASFLCVQGKVSRRRLGRFMGAEALNLRFRGINSQLLLDASDSGR